MLTRTVITTCPTGHISMAVVVFLYFYVSVPFCWIGFLQVLRWCWHTWNYSPGSYKTSLCSLQGHLYSYLLHSVMMMMMKAHKVTASIGFHCWFVAAFISGLWLALPWELKEWGGLLSLRVTIKGSAAWVLRSFVTREQIWFDLDWLQLSPAHTWL